MPKTLKGTVKVAITLLDVSLGGTLDSLADLNSQGYNIEIV